MYNFTKNNNTFFIYTQVSILLPLSESKQSIIRNNWIGLINASNEKDNHMVVGAGLTDQIHSSLKMASAQCVILALPG